MSWHDDCDTFDARIDASAMDANFNDTEFLLVQDDAEDATGDKVSFNKAILALISPVFYSQFYGPLSTNQPPPIEDGTARGFKQLINFIYNPTSFEFPVDNVEEVFEISYFGHKYQIGSLVSQCRKLLAKFNVEGKEVETLTWAVTTENAKGWEETLTAEYRLLLHRCWEQIEKHFVKIFPNGEIKEGQELLDEHSMLKILGMKELNASEDFILLVALDYYSKLVRNRPNVVQNKRLKVDSENEWNEKLVKIKSIITFNKVSPKKFAELFEKVIDKVSDKVMISITKSISSSWKDLDNLNRYSGDTVKRRMNKSERAGDSHRPLTSGPAARTSEFGGNSSRFASPSNLNNISKPRPRSGSFDSDVWAGGYHHSGSNGGYSSSPGMSNKGVGDFGHALSPPAKPFKPQSGLIFNPKQQQLSSRGVNMVQAGKPQSGLILPPKQQLSSRGVNMVQAGTLRTERSMKWTAVSGKVEKGQYNSWKDDIQPRGEQD